MRLLRWIAVSLLVAGAALPAAAQAPPAPAPSCEDRLAATAAYADLLRQVRDQYEQRVAELAAKVQALERAAAATSGVKPAVTK